MKEFLHFKKVSDYHKFANLSAPQHPLISLIDYSQVQYPENIVDFRWRQDYYAVGMKKNILNKCLEDLGIGLEKILHASQEFNYSDLVFVEDKISMKTIFKNAHEKNEGKLMFFVYESRFYNQNDIQVCVMINTLLVRS